MDKNILLFRLILLTFILCLIGFGYGAYTENIVMISAAKKSLLLLLIPLIFSFFNAWESCGEPPIREIIFFRR